MEISYVNHKLFTFFQAVPYMILRLAGVGSMASSLWAPPECDKDVDVDANVFLNEDFFLVTNAASNEEEALLLITD